MIVLTVSRTALCDEDMYFVMAMPGGGEGENWIIYGEKKKKKKPNSTLLVDKANKARASRFCSTASHHSGVVEITISFSSIPVSRFCSSKIGWRFCSEIYPHPHKQMLLHFYPHPHKQMLLHFYPHPHKHNINNCRGERGKTTRKIISKSIIVKTSYR